MKKILLILLMLFVLVSCNSPKNSIKEEKGQGDTKAQTNEENKNQDDKKQGGQVLELNQVVGYKEGNIKATMKTTMGDIKLILFPDAAPKAVENFVTHAKNGYYEGIIFHRVIEGFMIQGGDPTGSGRGGESIYGKSFEDEFSVYHRNFYGALSMANAGPNTNGSQFFIVTAKNNVSENILNQMKSVGEAKGYPDNVIEQYKNVGGAFHLDFVHTVFGQVVEGMDVVEAISKVERDSSDKPLKDVKIEKIIIEDDSHK